MSTKLKVLAGTLLVGLCAVAVWLLAPREEAGEPVRELRELFRSELDLRDGVLFAMGETEPFDGTLLEHFPGGGKRIALEIRSGRPHGLSRGWYENGRLEVEERFVRGVSHGLRRRWHANGRKKSEAHIVEGRIEGVFTRWHDNGRKAVVVTMVNGVPHGTSEAWDESGRLKSRAVMKRGELVEREVFENRDEPRPVKTSS